MKTIRQTRCSPRLPLAGVLLAGVGGLVLGWRLFWFLTDDAYIAFRYVSNSILGHGYVWNAPPFLPLEGYTSFLWIVMLDGIWRVLGVAPPESANWIALTFSCGTLLIAAAMVVRLGLRSWSGLSSVLLVALLVLYLDLNRTFLAWSSSGLETALMNFLLLLWVFVFLSRAPARFQVPAGSLTAAALALTRPDGLLFCAATALLVLLQALAQGDKRSSRQVLVYGALPFGVVLAHLAWRVSFYGEWLPNTYYAKVPAPWPESGLRYMLSFLLEYAIWLPAVIFAVAFVRWIAARWRELRAEGIREGARSALRGRCGNARPALIVVGALSLHVAYYTLIVGGDHFEYRVYSHLIPLGFVALVWSLNQLRASRSAAVVVTIVFVLLSLPVPWTHWSATKDLETRRETLVMHEPIAPQWPKTVHWYAELFDKMQRWLIYHYVCMRHQEHKVFWLAQVESHPPREEGREVSGDRHPVLAEWSVGVPSWVLPHVAVLDKFGLNDYVIARTPIPADRERLMAHMRRPPEGYVDSFRPNVDVEGGRVIVWRRSDPLASEEIRRLERSWRDSVRAMEQ
ncbi:MAG: hypothetical protein GF355_09985 [Candidatus Eisenbacteria bacterium]|nr:hypothetical protein [Candidatus Eisenbacteria bacterium]